MASYFTIAFRKTKNHPITINRSLLYNGIMGTLMTGTTLILQSSRGLGSKTPQVKRESSKNCSPPPLKKNIFSIFGGFPFLCRNIVMWAAFSPLASWISCGMAESSVRAVEHFWCSCPLRGQSNEFLFLGRPREFARPPSTSPRKSKDMCNGIRLLVYKIYQFWNKTHCHSLYKVVQIWPGLIFFL